ncbi:MAG: flagellar hook-basal body complex protein FliE [Deltaproteobacteria bacterium]|nr:MAG: flagellar hook-basal body complex protein FliE [Deltaproteobacteria bacterium]
MKNDAIQTHLLMMKQLAGQAANPFHPEKSEPAAGGFGQLLRESLGKIDGLQHKADEQVTAVQSGRSADMIEAIVALEEADMSFQLLLQVRNKAVRAYEEIMRMQL